jgi:thymidylate synthase (FAD)
MTVIVILLLKKRNPQMTDYKWTSKIKVDLISKMGEDLDVARSAWVSTQGERSEDEQDLEKVEGLINYLMKNRHGSPFEQCVMRWRVRAPIFVWREHHRHRIASYNEESGRYSQLAPEFYIPGGARPLVQVGKAGAYQYEMGTDWQEIAVEDAVKQANIAAYDAYVRMLGTGVAREVARICLPVNIFSTCYVTMNLRALMNFLSLRTKNEDSMFPSYPQYEIALVAEEYEATFIKEFPLVWNAFQINGRVAP